MIFRLERKIIPSVLKRSNVMNSIFNNPQNKYKKAFYSTISYSVFVISRPMARQHRNNVPYICIIYLEIDSLKWLLKLPRYNWKDTGPSGMSVREETHCTWLIQTNILRPLCKQNTKDLTHSVGPSPKKEQQPWKKCW